MRDRSENQIKLVVIRHGATKSNKEHRYLGKTNEPLSKEGKKQLEEYKEMEMFPEINQLFISPMKRCIQTADILYPNLSTVKIKEWEEMDFGVFEGKNYQELKDDIRYQKWIDSNGTLPFPEGESREEFIIRCDTGFKKMLEKVKLSKEKNITLGVIAHGGTIMALLSKYAGGDYFDYQTGNARGYVCIMSKVEKKLQVIEMKKI